MSKFDRCIFISIAIGIWAFVFVQIFEPVSLNAHGEDHYHYQFDETRDHTHSETPFHTHSYKEISGFASGVYLYEHSH